MNGIIIHAFSNAVTPLGISIAIETPSPMKFFIVILLSLTFLCPTNVSAQTIKTYGAKLAVTSAGQDFYYTMFDPNIKRRIGFNAAVFVEWLDIPFFSIVTQVEYAQRGRGVEFILTGSSGPEEIGRITLYDRLDYLSIPMLAKFTLPAGTISPYLSFGPRLDFLLGYKSEMNSNSVFDNFRKTNVGGTVAIGAEIVDFLSVAITLEVRYNLDFRDSFSSQFLRVRNNSFDLWLGAGL